MTDAPRTHDLACRAYARLSELRHGMQLEADGGFTCLREGERVRVRGRLRKNFYVPCASGTHRLDGQCDYNSDALIGLYRCEVPNA